MLEYSDAQHALTVHIIMASNGPALCMHIQDVVWCMTVELKEGVWVCTQVKLAVEHAHEFTTLVADGLYLFWPR